MWIGRPFGPIATEVGTTGRGAAHGSQALAQGIFETRKAQTGQDSCGREMRRLAQKGPTSLLKMMLLVLEKDGGYTDAVAALTLALDKKKSEDTVQVDHNKVKSLGGRWASLDRQLKFEEATVAKLRSSCSSTRTQWTRRGPRRGSQNGPRGRRRRPWGRRHADGGTGSGRDGTPGPVTAESQQAPGDLQGKTNHRGGSWQAARAAPAAKTPRIDGSEKDDSTQMDNGDDHKAA